MGTSGEKGWEKCEERLRFSICVAMVEWAARLVVYRLMMPVCADSEMG